MTLIILSREKQIIDLFHETTKGLGASLEVFAESTPLLERLHELDATPPSGVFIDLTGLSDGVHLVEWLRLSQRTRGLRVIIIGEESADIEIFQRAWGDETVFLKPLKAEALRELVAKLVQPAAEKPRRSTAQERRRLVEAIEHSKQLRAEQERLLAERNEIPRKRERRAAGGRSIKVNRPGLLYVGDNPAETHLFSTAVSQTAATFPLEFLGSFAEVVEHLREKGEGRRITSDRPGCLLVDYAAGGGSTGEIIKWIRGQSAFPDVLVIVLGDTDEPEIVRGIYRAGADYYLVKPKSFEGLIAIVNVLESGLRHNPPRFYNFIRLSDYRDPLGKSALDASPLVSRCAE